MNVDPHSRSASLAAGRASEVSDRPTPDASSRANSAPLTELGRAAAVRAAEGRDLAGARHSYVYAISGGKAVSALIVAPLPEPVGTFLDRLQGDLTRAKNPWTPQRMTAGETTYLQLGDEARLYPGSVIERDRQFTRMLPATSLPAATLSDPGLHLMVAYLSDVERYLVRPTHTPFSVPRGLLTDHLDAGMRLAFKRPRNVGAVAAETQPILTALVERGRLADACAKQLAYHEILRDGVPLSTRQEDERLNGLAAALQVGHLQFAALQPAYLSFPSDNDLGLPARVRAYVYEARTRRRVCSIFLQSVREKKLGLPQGSLHGDASVPAVLTGMVEGDAVSGEERDRVQTVFILWSASLRAEVTSSSAASVPKSKVVQALREGLVSVTQHFGERRMQEEVFIARADYFERGLAARLAWDAAHAPWGTPAPRLFVPGRVSEGAVPTIDELLGERLGFTKPAEVGLQARSAPATAQEAETGFQLVRMPPASARALPLSNDQRGTALEWVLHRAEELAPGRPVILEYDYWGDDRERLARALSEAIGASVHTVRAADAELGAATVNQQQGSLPSMPQDAIERRYEQAGEPLELALGTHGKRAVLTPKGHTVDGLRLMTQLRPAVRLSWERCDFPLGANLMLTTVGGVYSQARLEALRAQFEERGVEYRVRTIADRPALIWQREAEGR